MNKTSAKPFHVLANPVGARCNLNCSYCYYLEKERLYPDDATRTMSDESLERFVREYIAAQPGPEVHFLWQGGEPTLAGVEFYRRAIEFQKRYAAGRIVTNALQTNAILLDDEFCSFLKENDFLVGVSVDGPAELHDTFRRTKGENESLNSTLRGLERLKHFGVRFNLLCVVHRDNAKEPLRVYEFLKRIGGTYIQFLPLVERFKVDASSTENQLAASSYQGETIRAEWNVVPEDYGNFLKSIFDHWFAHDVGKIFVQLFDVTLESWLGYEPSLCVFRTTCGDAIAIEKNGDIYSCDRYVFPEYSLGNLTEKSLAEMLHSESQIRFGQAKKLGLPKQCRECDVLFACKGECPKNRFAKTGDGEPGLNYLCAAYLAFFRHIAPSMNEMAKVIEPNFIERRVR